MSTLQAVWQSITALLADNISLIPIRDKDDEFGVAKSPLGKWTKYQKEKLSEQELWYNMEKYNTAAVGCICGAVSGNLECVDIDEKHMPGISARVFSDIKTLYPDLFDKLRIHGTPSKGFHFIYRCINVIDGNLKLAGRPANDNELLANPKAKPVYFLETRGEGGYFAAPPSLGYVVVQGKNIPTISQDERAGLLSLCRQYSYILPPAAMKPYKPTVSDNQYYETNPFDDFNTRCHPSEIAKECGWNEYKHNNKFVWFTRPGGTARHVHLSFNIERRFYFCFTGNTELEASHGYTPANFVCQMLHGGDKKKTYRYLVQNGYGRIKPEVESQIAKRSATNKKPLPANISATGAAIHVAISQQIENNYPHGTFWFDDIEKGILIDRERLYIVADGLGFKLHNENNIIQLISNTIYDRTQREFFDSVKSYIKEEDEETYFRICNSYEAFIEKHGKFTIGRLQHLNMHSVIQDTRTDCYKFYQNGMLHITSDGFTLKPIPSNLYVFNKNIQPREFSDCDTGLYVDFLEKAIGITPYLLSCIGYLAHDFKDDTAGYIIVLSEQCINPKDGGGSGKNIFSGLFRYTTTFFSKAGSQVKYDEKFMQAWNFQKVYSIADVLKNFNFEFLKEFTAGSATMKKLHVNEYSIPTADMPKFLISTNFSYEIKDGGIKRRVRPIEFTDFFTKVGGVDVFYNGKHFTDDWAVEDWGGYDTTMAISVQTWLACKRKLPTPVLTQGGWYKQFEHSYGRIVNGIIHENIEDWCVSGFVSNDVFKQDCQRYYDENNVIQKYRPSSFSFNEALEEWCRKFNIKYDKDTTDRVQMIVVRGRHFKKI